MNKIEQDRLYNAGPKTSRRKFIASSLKAGLGLGAVISGVDKILPEDTEAKLVEKEHPEKQTGEMIYMLEYVKEAFLSGKRINLLNLKKQIDSFLNMRGIEYKGSHMNAMLEALNSEGFTIDQIGDILNETVEHILKEMDNGKIGVQEIVYRLEDLKVGRMRPYKDIIRMAQLYALSSSSNGPDEYGLNFIIYKKNPEIAIITESLHGRSQSVAMDIEDELSYGPDYEIISLHTHPDDFSFFSIVGDLTYYLDSIDNVQDLKQFTAKMVDKSGIVWSMKFDKMTEEQLFNIKRQFVAYQIFFVEYGNILQILFPGNELSSIAQVLLQDDYSKYAQKLIDKLLKTSKNNTTEERKKFQKLQKLKNAINELPKKIPDLKALHQTGIKILGSREKDVFVKAVLSAQDEFKKRGIRIYPEVPGRIKNIWNKSQSKK